MSLHTAARKPAVRWSGSFFAYHSLALVNRELSRALLENSRFRAEFELSVDERGPRGFVPEENPGCRELIARCGGASQDAAVTVRHMWPPDFRSAGAGRLVLCQPWEFGSLPREWVTEIGRSVQEVWAYTEFVRQTYIGSGVPADKVHIVPLGIDPQRFHPNVIPFDFTSRAETMNVRAGDFKFLFVGGTIPRKGIDILLDAFDRTFRAGDSVTLIVKDFGTESFYANQCASILIRALQSKPGGARIAYLPGDLSETQMASLYAACDCLVQPYRGEGYGLPIAEAMACGKPAIVTGAGAAMDFANAQNAYLIPAARQYLTQNEISGMATVSRPFWLEPDGQALQNLLRQVVNDKADVAAKGVIAARSMAERHTWAHAAEQAALRFAKITTQQTAPRLTYSLPLGLANFGLSAADAKEPQSESDPYETRKQKALAGARSGNGDAITELAACLLEQPGDWDVLNALAVAKFRAGDRASALEDLRRGTTEAPDVRDFHHNLAFVLLADSDLADPNEALEHATLAFKCSPDDAAIRSTLDRARDAVLRSARKILRRHPDRARAKRDTTYRTLMDAYRSTDPGMIGMQMATTQVEEAPAPPRTRISLVMIVKNEEAFLRNCLESARDIVDEIVIVDTGSTDATCAVAAEFGAKVIHHTWNDDFSEARNVSIRHATGDWAIWLDADEEIAPESRQSFRDAVQSAAQDVGGYMVTFRNWLQCTTRRDDSEMAVHHACRLFRLVPGVRFEGRIHEQNLRSLQNLGYKYAYEGGLTVDHFGYAGEVMTARNKHERFIRMLTREVEECPDPTLKHFHLFNLGNAYFTYGDMENAVTYLRRAAENPDVQEEFTAILFTELATALNQLGRPEEGLDACSSADAAGVEHSGIAFARGHCLLHLRRYADAEAAFQSALLIGSMSKGAASAGDRGTSGHKALYGLALALVGQERYEEGLIECTKALEDHPVFIEARSLMGVILSRLSRWQEAAEALEAVLEHAPDHGDARNELAQVLYEMGDLTAALPHLEEAARLYPDEVEVNARLAACYERADRPAAAAAVYERLRALAPTSAEVCVNLGRALADAGSDAEALECFTEAIRLDPRYGNAYFNAGDLLYRLEQYPRAAEVYMAGLQVSPQHPAGFFVLGNCLFHTRDYDAAVVSFQQELAQNPEHEQARANLALVRGLTAGGAASRA